MSIGDISLTAGMRANLVSLQGTAGLVQSTQGHLSTGKKVTSAIDNPIEFFASQNMLNQANDLASYKDGMSNAIQTIQAATQGISGITTLVAQAQALTQSAVGASKADQWTMAQQYNALETQITNMAADSGFQGVNLIAATPGSLTVAFSGTTGDNLSVAGVASDAVGLGLTAATGSALLGWSTLATDTTNVGAANTTLRTTTTSLAGNVSIITARQNFSTNMINVLQTGSDNLTLADTNQEGANMLMLQTRQSLGTTALSLASQSAQAVLKLFG